MIFFSHNEYNNTTHEVGGKIGLQKLVQSDNQGMERDWNEYALCYHSAARNSLDKAFEAFCFWHLLARGKLEVRKDLHFL